MTILSTLALVSGIGGTFAFIPQVYKIFKRKSAKDISIVSYLYLLISGIIWVFYGFEVDSYPIVIPQLVGNIALVFIVIGWFLYGREVEKNEET